MTAIWDVSSAIFLRSAAFFDESREAVIGGFIVQGNELFTYFSDLDGYLISGRLKLYADFLEDFFSG